MASAHLLAVLVLVGITLLYFRPQLDGRVVPQGDLIQYEGMTREILEVEQATGEKPLWTNGMFGGMPTYQINTPDNGNYLRLVDKAFRLGFEHPIGLFLPALLSFYLLMIGLGVAPATAAIGAFAFAFTTNSLTLYEAGHITKLRAISCFPLVAAGMALAYRGRYAGGAVIFATGLGLNVMANHVQMTYYLALTLPVFVVAQGVADLRARRLPQFARASAALLCGGVLAVGSSTAMLWSTYEYARETTRGRKVLAVDGGAAGSSASRSGLAWDYAMQWSAGPVDLLAAVVPGVAGGSSNERLSGHSAVEQDLRARGYQTPDGLRFPLYWGALPSTSGPAYLGASVLVLFVIGLFIIEGPIRWWTGVGALITVLLSLGRHVPAVNGALFAHLPLYDHFRAPNSVLAVTAFLVPVLATMALDRVVRADAPTPLLRRGLLASGGVVGGLSLALFLLGSAMFDFAHAQDAAIGQVDVRALVADRQALLGRDALRSLLVVAAVGSAVWAFGRRRIGRPALIATVAMVVLFDLWTVDRRYVGDDSFVSPDQRASAARARTVDLEILSDVDPHYRVFDTTVPSFQSAQPSWFHRSIGGYHAAKLRRYQDLIDRHLARGNRAVLDMLDTRYVIVRGVDGQSVAQRNERALGAAWFVSGVTVVDTAEAEIAALDGFDPMSTAIVHREFAAQVGGRAPSGSRGTVGLTSSRPDHLVYEASSAQDGLVVFSEIWYGPDLGWQATIDGRPAEILRADYVLRALRVPAGRHRIEFVFRPRSFLMGRTISRVCSGLTLLGLLAVAGAWAYGAVRDPRR